VRTYREGLIALYGQDFKVGGGFPKQVSVHDVTPFLVCLVNVLTDFSSNELSGVTFAVKPPLQANHEQLKKNLCMRVSVVQPLKFNPLPNI
jgi:hypothetical protein